MPRDGSGIYHAPHGPVVEDTTIESAVYNGFVGDVTTDLNAPRPVLAGGTGSTNPDDALGELGAEKDGQEVTNYGSHIWRGGSFWSSGGATDEPVSDHDFIGIVYMADDDNIVVEARDVDDGLVPGKTFVRHKKDGLWGVWALEAETQLNAKVDVAGDTMTGPLTLHEDAPEGDMDAVPKEYVDEGLDDRVATAGDTMTGNLTINADSGKLIFTRGDAGAANATMIEFNIEDDKRWEIIAPYGEETSPDQGSDFSINRFPDTGSGFPVLTLERDTGRATFFDQLRVFGYERPTHVELNTFSTSPQPCIVQGQKSQLARWSVALVDGTAEGAEGVGSDFKITRHNNAGTAVDTPLGISRLTATISYTTAQPQFILNKTVIIGENLIRGSHVGLNRWAISLGNSITETGSEAGSNFGIYSYADAGSFLATEVQINRATHAFIIAGEAYKPGGGSWIDSSDARIKNVEGDYQRGLDEVAALRPVIFTFKGNDTAEPPRQIDGDNKSTPVVPYPNSPHQVAAAGARKFAGLVAQEVEAVMPELVKQRAGYIDGQAVTDLRDIDTTPLLFALVNSIKELKARIEELEASTP